MPSSIANTSIPQQQSTSLTQSPGTSVTTQGTQSTTSSSLVHGATEFRGHNSTSLPPTPGLAIAVPTIEDARLHTNYNTLHSSLAYRNAPGTPTEKNRTSEASRITTIEPCGISEKTSTNLPPLVLIHGLKGGHLKDVQTGQRRYLRTAQLFNPTRYQDPPALPLKRDPVKGTQAKDNLVPDGIIKNVDLLGFNLASFYGPFIDEFKDSRDLRLFSYDWRRDLDEGGEAIETFLEQVIKETGSKQGVQVVCHSMGGLITFPVLNRRPELFHSVLFAAAALGGGISFLRDLAERDEGNGMGPINKSMFTPERWVSWPSVWTFFNGTGEREAQGKSEATWSPLREADGTTLVPCDFHNLDDWKRLKLGPYGPASSVSEVSSEMEIFLQETLTRAKDYRQQLVHNPAVNYPPIAVLRSDAAPTITQLCRPSPDGAFDYDAAFTTPGDGRITLEDTLPPKGVPLSAMITNHVDHSNILGELGDVQELLNTLIMESNARRRQSSNTPDCPDDQPPKIR